MQSKTKIYAFIFVRKNSKRIKNKNLRKIKNYTLLELSINLSKKIKLIDKTFVSTDCRKMAAIAKKLGCEVIIRPKRLTADNSPEIESWKYTITQVKKKYNNDFIFLSLPATSPLRRKKDVIKCIRFVKNLDYELCLTITKTNLDPYFNMLELNKKKFVPVIKSLNRRTNRKFYSITTVAYCAKTSYIKKANNLMEGNIKYLEVPFPYSIDIDELNDLKIAKMFSRK